MFHYGFWKVICFAIAQSNISDFSGFKYIYNAMIKWIPSIFLFRSCLWVSISSFKKNEIILKFICFYIMCNMKRNQLFNHTDYCYTIQIRTIIYIICIFVYSTSYPYIFDLSDFVQIILYYHMFTCKMFG